MEHARHTVMDCGIPASGETGKKEKRRKAGIQAPGIKRGRIQTMLKSLSGMEERRSGGAEATRHISGAGSSAKRPRLDGSRKTNARATQRVKAIRAALMEVFSGEAVGFDMDNGDKKM